MAPVVLALRERPGIESLVCVTAQHRQMLDQALAVFGLRPDIDLDLMRPGQDLFDLTARMVVALRPVLQDIRPDLALVQGDTTTTFAAALAAFYAGVPVGHVEAGLRTHDLRAPFPEEANRALVGRLAGVHFAATERARANLLAEGTPAGGVWVTGNTVIDALLLARELAERRPAAEWRERFGPTLHDRLAQTHSPVVLVTGHRRENFGANFEELCSALRELAVRHADWTLVFPVHLNPNVRGPVLRTLSGLANVFLIEPLDYLPFVWLMTRATLILTDSGGIQEEAPSLGKPVLVLREVTERPEAVEAGTALLVGTDRRRIVASVESLLREPDRYRAMSAVRNPYGDGHAAERIVEILLGRAGAGGARSPGVVRDRLPHGMPTPGVAAGVGAVGTTAGAG
jgi:UDP-N-acetylglucosamine 2-epimerase (non-hydrolysing)